MRRARRVEAAALPVGCVVDELGVGHVDCCTYVNPGSPTAARKALVVSEQTVSHSNSAGSYASAQSATVAYKGGR